ncbi:MAG: hypothetical protein VE98_C0001G0450 [candidate division Kazan bacterium GW2011_GWA1_50_15]|uniref:DUF5666 domain-containing protein n=2 Tax=Bacteria division Kazan-3B-28 TaxID=1798534 RepID=A0A0G1X8K9_UNCK3|nr:MAG: hypothetical protein VE98_C0001G0450 [candidate division Kazan bacterium GW2011_GWA1_50_15]KKW25861.1 MAG: hypothetical protein VE99_C0001G0500 [candidate division Kazan bacterium GW2011_GWC1_52_13]KKW27125.1 MAG: hypothetical protein VF00_C0001G0060 [candidate division Kazan bacterium GW2011_GWB1_52_7]HCR42413.1 hypothetical protein [Patescibacteria group bacterium]
MTFQNIYSGTIFIIKTLLLATLALVALVLFAPKAEAATTMTGTLITSYGYPAVRVNDASILTITDRVVAPDALWAHVGQAVEIQGDVQDSTISNVFYLVSLDDGTGLIGQRVLSDNVGGPTTPPVLVTPPMAVDRLEGWLIIRTNQPALDISPALLYGAYSEVQLIGVEDISNTLMGSLTGRHAAVEGRLDGLTLQVDHLWAEGNQLK